MRTGLEGPLCKDKDQQCEWRQEKEVVVLGEKWSNVHVEGLFCRAENVLIDRIRESRSFVFTRLR